MHNNVKCPFSVEETEDGYAIHIKGDKEKLKAKLEAVEAYKVFREKALAAGLHHHRCGRSGGLLSLIHKHIQAVHEHHQQGRS
ncbi:MAG TPA: hypothetical protein VHS59_12580 [Bacillota bacterium]|nr:hypothetical protein [Bacillota bacterium]